jgi:hypothetical protein
MEKKNNLDKLDGACAKSPSNLQDVCILTVKALNLTEAKWGVIWIGYEPFGLWKSERGFIWCDMD